MMIYDSHDRMDRGIIVVYQAFCLTGLCENIQNINVKFSVSKYRKYMKYMNVYVN